MIVASLLLVIVAAVTLVIGLFNPENPNWVWTSIGCCLLAGLLLIVGVLRSRPRRKPVLQSGTDQPASWAGASSWSGAEGQDAALSRDDTGVRVIDEPAPTPASADDTSVVAPASPPADSGADTTAQWAPEPAPEPATAEAGHDAPAQSQTFAPEPRDAPPAQDLEPFAQPAGSEQTAGSDAASADGPAAAAVVPKARAPRAAAAASGMTDADRINAALSSVAGVGPTKRNALIQSFGTYRKLRAASVEKIAATPGISRTLAERIHSALHS